MTTGCAHPSRSAGTCFASIENKLLHSIGNGGKPLSLVNISGNKQSGSASRKSKPFSCAGSGNKLHLLSGLNTDNGPTLTLNNMDCNEGTLSLQYEEVKESSFSEVVMRTLSHSIRQCYEFQSLSEPEIQDIPLSDYCPLEHGPYSVCQVLKGDELFMETVFEPSRANPDVEESHYTFPKSSERLKTGKLILHAPSELCGSDGNRLIVAVISSCHGDSNVRYTWHKNGHEFKQGKSMCSIPIDEAGNYAV